MVKKSSLAKKLASYSAVAAAVLVSDKNVDAQIVYTNLTSGDTVGRYDMTDYKLDLNNDGIYDFDFRLLGAMGSFGYYRYEISCYAYSQNKILGDIFPTPLNYGDTISVNKSRWGSLNRLASICHFNGCDPEFDTAWQDKEHYIGLKVLKNKNTYYGWARVTVDYGYNGFRNNDVFAIIDEYAINSIPDSAIYAGEECPPNYTQPSLQIMNNTISTNATNHIQWTINGRPMPGDTTQNITLSQYGLYQVREGDTTQCYTESPTFNYIDCNTYKPNIGSEIQPICWPNFSTLQIDTVPIDYSIKWFQNNELLLGSVNSILNYVGTAGNYFAVIYENGGCFDTSNVVRVVLDSTVSSVVIKQDVDTLFAVRKFGIFPSNVIYQWYDSLNNAINGADKYYYIIPVNAGYSVIVIDSNLCRGYNEGYFLTTSINQINPSNILIAESNNLLNIKFNEEPYYGYKLVIYNYIGQQVYNAEITSSEMMFNLNSLAKGLYLVTLEKENSRVVKKIVLQ